MSGLSIQVEPHLACFKVLICDWDPDKKEGYIEVDFGEGRISGFHCHADRLEFAMQMIQAFGQRCQGLEKDAFTNRIEALHKHRLFCDLHKGEKQINYVVIHKIDRLGKDLECVGHHLQLPPTKLYKSRIEEEEWQYLQSLAEMHQSETVTPF